MNQESIERIWNLSQEQVYEKFNNKIVLKFIEQAQNKIGKSVQYNFKLSNRWRRYGTIIIKEVGFIKKSEAATNKEIMRVNKIEETEIWSIICDQVRNPVLIQLRVNVLRHITDQIKKDEK